MLIHGTSLGMSKDGGGAFLIHYSLWFIRSKAMLAAQNEDRTESARRPEIVVGKAEKLNLERTMRSGPDAKPERSDADASEAPSR